MNLLRVKKVAEILDITERTIWNKIKRGELPTITIAGITRIDGDKFQSLMDSQPTYNRVGLVHGGGTTQHQSVP